MHTSDLLLAETSRLHPKMIDMSLGRIERLLSRMGSPHENLPPVVHVAGTNGKGSVIAFLKAILEAAGKRVHVYTSPHLVSFHERIQLARPYGRSTQVTEEELVDLLSRTLSMNAGCSITQFEATTAATFLAFAERPADFALVEVGLGGRLDATNVITDPALSIITSISVDHAEILGPSASDIAREKAGIMKRGVPCIVGAHDSAVGHVFREQSAKVGAMLIASGEHFSASSLGDRMTMRSGSDVIDLPRPRLLGQHQIGNAVLAVRAAQEVLGSALTREALVSGLSDVSWPARLQRLATGSLASRLSSGSELWLDGGHNPAAGASIAAAMGELNARSRKTVYLIVGMLASKDAAGFLAPFRGLAARLIAVPVPDASVTSFAPSALVQAGNDAGIPGAWAASLEVALDSLEAFDPHPKRVLICGSLYLAGAAIRLQNCRAPAEALLTAC